MAWNKTEVDPALVKHISQRYHVSTMEAVVLTRRGIVDGDDIKFFLENDMSYLHNPFVFKDMENAVDRILLAAQNKEKVLIFGDRDVDGITGTTILVKTLKELSLDVQWQVPLGESGYGLSIESISRAAEDNVTLIITIDCGISNIEEVDHANSLGIDVLVFDHHNVGSKLPNAHTIINAKVESQGYPFTEICAAMVALKIRMAVAFSQTQLYKQEQCLLNIVPLHDAYRFDVMSVRNLVCQWRKSITVTKDNKQHMLDSIVDLLQNATITVYNSTQQISLFNRALGGSLDLQCIDIQKTAQKHIATLKDKSLLQICQQSKFFRYLDETETPNELDALYRVYKTSVLKEFPSYTKSLDDVIDLVALATVADIMPLVNENRTAMYLGLQKIRNNPCIGLDALMQEAGVKRDPQSAASIDTRTIGWRITPIINASGRMGQANLGVELLLETDPIKALTRAAIINKLNSQRKNQMDHLKKELIVQAEQSIKTHTCFAVVYNEKLPHTFTGILAGQLAKKYNVPCIVFTKRDATTISGSIRCHKDFFATNFLQKLQEYFIDFGGHRAAAGFSIKKETLPAFQKILLENLHSYIKNDLRDVVQDNSHTAIDLEIPQNLYTPTLIKQVANMLCPYGETWNPIHLLFNNLRVESCNIIGGAGEHAKFVVQIGSYKVPALLWKYQDYCIDTQALTPESVVAITNMDIICTVKCDVYMGMEQVSLIIEELNTNTEPKTG